MGVKKNETLDVLNDGKAFDQFAGKVASTYSDSIYSTVLDIDKMPENILKKGLELEREIISM